ncbi:MAG: hypothetical protein V7K97_18085 [Nostoc sp.]|uniref:hypothetical protein n=1 Tax=Nostoc sp. TaxID=1180 RepID=UPI002FF50F6C
MNNAIKGVPWEQCRGIETTDVNDYLILIQAPIEKVAQAISQVRQVVVWERDVYEHEIEILAYGFIIFQFRGHSWTVISQASSIGYSVTLDEEDAQSLSNLLHTKAICYLISDTGLKIGYKFYNCNELLEELYFTSEIEGEFDDEYEEEEEEDDDTKIEGTYHFQSHLRQLNAKDIENPYVFTDTFLREQDAYVPAFFHRCYLSLGQRITMRLGGLKHEDLERMDYLVLT